MKVQRDESCLTKRCIIIFISIIAHPPNGIWVTTAGDMNAKYIIHLDSSRPGRDSTKWTEAIVECLTESDTKEATSIAFPALGTGNQTVST